MTKPAMLEFSFSNPLYPPDPPLLLLLFLFPTLTIICSENMFCLLKHLYFVKKVHFFKFWTPLGEHPRHGILVFKKKCIFQNFGPPGGAPEARYTYIPKRRGPPRRPLGLNLAKIPLYNKLLYNYFSKFPK